MIVLYAVSIFFGVSKSISENTHHRPVTLLLGKQPRVVFVVALVAIDNDVLRGRNQTVLYATESSEGLLIGSGMEETDILRSAQQFR